MTALFNALLKAPTLVWRLAFPSLHCAVPRGRAFAGCVTLSAVDARLLVVDGNRLQGRKDKRYQSRSLWSLLDPERKGTAQQPLDFDAWTRRPSGGRYLPEKWFDSVTATRERCINSAGGTCVCVCSSGCVLICLPLLVD
jgi:hypothetical protein